MASPGGSRTVTGFPVIFVVSTPSIQTCPVTVAAPQASVALMKAGQWLGGVPRGRSSRAAAVVEHALVGRVVGTGDRLYSWL